jgi:hypothetical protein
MVVLDNLGAPREVIDEAKKIASDKTGIPMNRMLVSSTHTHSGPSATEAKGDYRKLLIEGLAESIVKAQAALRPAAVGAAAHALPEEVFNRRWFLKPGKMPLNPFGQLDKVKMNPGTNPEVLDRPAGPTDPDVSILSVQDAKRKPIALYANYSLHYVGGVRDGMSADYYGEFARLVRSRVNGGEDFVGMMSNGTSGDINNIPFGVTRPPREPYEQIRIVAGKAADAAWFARQKIEKHDPAAKLGMVEREITLKLRHPTPEQLAAANAVLEQWKDPAAREKLPRLADSYARSAQRAAEKPESMQVQLQAIRIGDLMVCAIPFETFVEIGLELKKRSPFPKTMVVGLANARHGYLPTPEQHQLGGYETWLGTNMVEENASRLITEELVKMMGELK